MLVHDDWNLCEIFSCEYQNLKTLHIRAFRRKSGTLDVACVGNMCGSLTEVRFEEVYEDVKITGLKKV